MFELLVIYPVGHLVQIPDASPYPAEHYFLHNPSMSLDHPTLHWSQYGFPFLIEQAKQDSTLQSKHWFVRESNFVSFVQLLTQVGVNMLSNPRGRFYIKLDIEGHDFQQSWRIGS